MPTIAGRTRAVAAQAPVVAIRFLGDYCAAFVLSEQTLLLATMLEERRVDVHDGAILSVAGDGRRVVTGGDDGKVVATDLNASATVATDPKRRWIDQVAIGPSDAVAWSAGKTVGVEAGKGKRRTLDLPSSIGGLAFAPKGFRLAIAHYNGVTLWFPNAEVDPEVLSWRGSHLAVSWSPDRRFVMTAMQEPVLHGWRLADRKDMRMSGYQTKVGSLDWTADGHWLATSGSTELILWPFQGKDGPMGKTPRMLAPMATRITQVACHPRAAVVAVGYADGLMLLIRLDAGELDAGEEVVRRPGQAAISALAWNRSGSLLAFGTEDGEAGLVGPAPDVP
jgi:WD40 repeat protein